MFPHRDRYGDRYDADATIKTTRSAPICRPGGGLLDEVLRYT
jgi:hypothetical protein